MPARQDADRDPADGRMRDADTDEGEPAQHDEEAEDSAHESEQHAGQERALHELELQH